MFKAKKGYFIIYILISLLFPLSLWVITGSSIDNLLWLLPSLIPFALFMWIYFSTKYELINEEFHYQSAFLKGKIPVAKIKSIQNNKTLWSGIKPAMATKGLIIRYGFDEVYVAPEDNKALINELLKINPEIIITQ